MAKLPYYAQSATAALKALKTSRVRGLTANAVARRQETYGLNRIARETRFTKLRVLARQFTSPLIYILVAAGFITLLLQDYKDSIVIFIAVFLNASVGFVQELKATDALKKLKRVAEQKAHVLRGGNRKIIPSRNVVPGDIVLLQSGDKVPADARLVEVQGLTINESALTGEWLPTVKKTGLIANETPLADRDNMVYMGTLVEDGTAVAVVTATGSDTEIGHIAQLLKQTKDAVTPLQKKLMQFSRIVGIIIGIVAFIIFIGGLVTSESLRLLAMGAAVSDVIHTPEFLEIFITPIALAVAAIPEGLPIAMTVILALGTQRILARRGLIRKLLAAETLGSTSVICTDKTGTLTEAKMEASEAATARQILDDTHHTTDERLLYKAASFASDAFVENPTASVDNWIIHGTPTDRAMLEAGIKAEVYTKSMMRGMKRVADIPFLPKNKYLAKLYTTTGKPTVYVVGAPEKLVQLAATYEARGTHKKLTAPQRKKLMRHVSAAAKKGLRVIAVAHRPFTRSRIPTDKMLPGEIKNLTILGFIALHDPLRSDVKHSLKKVKQAGVRPIIVTGDHKLTATAIATELGMKVTSKEILEGTDIDQMSDEELAQRIVKTKIYARVEPTHKMRIVEAWQARHEIVAMTGDGINDAPALKKADIGVALGSGTDVAKEVADLVLLSNSFSIIEAAIEEGRAIVDNIRKVVTYLLSDSFSEVVLIGAAIMFGWPLPLTAAHILWINLIEDGPLSIALAFEKKEKDIMKQKPRGRNVALLTREMKSLIIIIGIATNILILGLFWWLLNYSGYDIDHMRTVTFAALSISSILYLFSCKSLRHNIWHTNLFDNRFLLYSWVGSVVALLAALYLPPLQNLLNTVTLNSFDWMLILGISFTNIALIEIIKWYYIARKQFA